MATVLYFVGATFFGFVALARLRSPLAILDLFVSVALLSIGTVLTFGPHVGWAL